MTVIKTLKPSELERGMYLLVINNSFGLPIVTKYQVEDKKIKSFSKWEVVTYEYDSYVEKVFEFDLSCYLLVETDV